MDWFTRLAGETRARLLALLRRSDRSIPDLSRALGISDTAVRNHVAALQRDGLVERAAIERDTGGKPARLYRLAPAAEELFPKAYAFVIRELLRMLEERDGREAVIELLRELGRRAAASAADGGAGASMAAGASTTDGGAAVAARVAAAADVLRDLGGEVEVERVGADWHIQGHGCPLSAVVRENAEVCALAASLVEEITGRPVTECCERGDLPKCTFRVAGEGNGLAAAVSA